MLAIISTIISLTRDGPIKDQHEKKFLDIELATEKPVRHLSRHTQQGVIKGSLILHKGKDNIKTIYDFYDKKEDDLALKFQKIKHNENRLIFPPRIPSKVGTWGGVTRISLTGKFW